MRPIILVLVISFLLLGGKAYAESTDSVTSDEPVLIALNVTCSPVATDYATSYASTKLQNDASIGRCGNIVIARDYASAYLPEESTSCSHNIWQHGGSCGLCYCLYGAGIVSLL